MINTFDIDKNFWIEHPDMKVITPFKQVYEDDKSKKKTDSSLLMWFIVLCYDRDSKFFKLPSDEKHEIIGEDYCSNKKFYKENKAILDASIDMYTKLQHTSVERFLDSWNKKFDQRSKWLDNLSYEDDDDEKIDKAMERTKKIYDMYKSILDDLSKEGNEGSAKGGAQESLSD